MKTYKIFFIFLLSATFLAGCVGTDITDNNLDNQMLTPTGEETSLTKPQPVPYWQEVFTISDDGRIAHTKYGEVVRIELEGNAATGPVWVLDGGGLPVLDDPNGTYIPSDPENPGAGGVYAFAFDTVDPGIYTIAGREIGFNEENRSPATAFSLRVQVTTMVPP